MVPLLSPAELAPVENDIAESSCFRIVILATGSRNDVMSKFSLSPAMVHHIILCAFFGGTLLDVLISVSLESFLPLRKHIFDLLRVCSAAFIGFLL